MILNFCQKIPASIIIMKKKVNFLPVEQQCVNSQNLKLKTHYKTIMCRKTMISKWWVYRAHRRSRGSLGAPDDTSLMPIGSVRHRRVWTIRFSARNASTKGLTQHRHVTLSGPGQAQRGVRISTTSRLTLVVPGTVVALSRLDRISVTRWAHHVLLL